MQVERAERGAAIQHGGEGVAIGIGVVDQDAPQRGHVKRRIVVGNAVSVVHRQWRRR